MTGNRKPDGMFAAMGRAADESLEIAEEIRAGKLTRPKFEAWYAKRRAEGTGLVLTMRAKTAQLAEPVQSAFEQGVEALRPATPRRAHRARRSHRSSKSK